MSCPYCYGTLELYKRVTYRCYEGQREVQWVRCTRCQHKTLAPREQDGGLIHQRQITAA